MTSGRQWESFVSFIRLRFLLHRLEIIIIIRIGALDINQTGSWDIRLEIT